MPKTIPIAILFICSSSIFFLWQHGYNVLCVSKVAEGDLGEGISPD
jgi:hypothetical protein